MVYRRLPSELPDKRIALDAMGRCRKVLIAESGKVKPFGPVYVEIQRVTQAMDVLAAYLTGNDTFYSVGMRNGWGDSGS